MAVLPLALGSLRFQSDQPGSDAPTTLCTEYRRARHNATKSIDAVYFVTANRLIDFRIAIASMIETSTCRLNLHIVCKEEEKIEILEKISEVEREFITIEFYRMPEHNLDHNTFAVSAVQKLYLDTILPPTLNQVILLDVDTLFVGDICSARAVLSNLDKKPTLFGFAAEMSPWYMRAEGWGNITKLRSPTTDSEILGHNYFAKHFWGYNSGVVFWNLARAREAQWSKQIPELASASMRLHKMTILQMGDQDIFNLACFHNPQYCATLSNDWNFQLLNQGGREDYPLHSVVVYHGNNKYFREEHLPTQAVLKLYLKSIEAVSATECNQRLQAKSVFDEMIQVLFT